MGCRGADGPTTIAAPPEVVAGLRILYEDDDVVVVDKPVGVAEHPSPGWTGPTVLGGLAALGVRVSTSGAAERQGIVHRLDVGTTGVMVVAKSEHAYSVLKRAFKERTVEKRYHAVVQGHPDPSRGTVDAPIDRHQKHDYKWAVVADGRAGPGAAREPYPRTRPAIERMPEHGVRQHKIQAVGHRKPLDDRVQWNRGAQR